MTADRLHQVPAPDSPWGSLGMVTESLKSGTPRCADHGRPGVMRQCPGTDPRYLYPNRAPALRSLRPCVLASHLGRPGTPRLAGLRLETAPGQGYRFCITQQADGASARTRESAPLNTSCRELQRLSVASPPRCTIRTVKVVTGDTACLFRGASCYVNAGLVPNDYRLEPVRWLHERWSADERRVMLHVFR